MFARLLLAVVVTALAVAGCDDRLPPVLRTLSESRCRRACFFYGRLKCATVEAECGASHGIIVVEGLRYDCKDAEAVACRLHEGMESCLAKCEDAGAR